MTLTKATGYRSGVQKMKGGGGGGGGSFAHFAHFEGPYWEKAIYILKTLVEIVLLAVDFFIKVVIFGHF